MARRSSLRSELYRSARILGNVEAASQGPSAYVKRYARRKVYSRSNTFSHSILRAFNLSK